MCRVIDRKLSRGEVFLVTDGGLHHHLAASGNFGQVIRKNYPVGSATGRCAEREVTTVVGPLCTPLDLLADRLEISRSRTGRPGHGLAVRSLRPDRQPVEISESSRTVRGPGLSGSHPRCSQQ